MAAQKLLILKLKNPLYILGINQLNKFFILHRKYTPYPHLVSKELLFKLDNN